MPIMLLEYLQFCPPGLLFHDRAPVGEGYPMTGEAPPDGWSRTDDDQWVCLWPPRPLAVAQGWKVHVSTIPERAEAVLAVVRDYCVPRQLMFKFLRSPYVLTLRGSKYGDRSASGKFVTVYPQDETELAQVLEELGAALEGEPGPYILSDLRWRNGPLYVRYGGFVPRYGTDASGTPFLAVEDPSGRLVPDHRRPSFRPPEWVTIPACLEEAVRARGAGGLGDFPFAVQAALHFSNGGGVYRAVDNRTGSTVLLKEARPLAGLDGFGEDAVRRLEREHRALQRLAGVSGIPQVVDYRKGREHYFLARELVEGSSLVAETERRNPWIRQSAFPHRPVDADAYREYVDWALDVLQQIERIIEEMHGRGVVFGDLHPNNVLIGPSGRVTLIDFECCSDAEDAARQGLACPGYQAPPGLGGTDVDRYALGCLRLAIFFPVAALLEWGRPKIEEILRAICDRFPLPDTFVKTVWRDLQLDPSGDGPSAVPPVAGTDSGTGGGSGSWPDVVDADAWPALRRRSLDLLGDCATPERRDRLFPGDVRQFLVPCGGVTLAYGAAGVLWAIDELGGDVAQTWVDWLDSAADGVERPGLYDGLAGVAHTLARLGRMDRALDLLDRVRMRVPEGTDPSLHAGLSGIGLVLLDLAARTGREDLLDDAAALGRQVGGGAAEPRRAADPGLLTGASGEALFLFRLAEATGDDTWTEQAEDALWHDLAALGWAREGGAGTEPAVVPGVEQGPAGVALVLSQVLAHRPAPRLAAVRAELLARLDPPLTTNGGLFRGRAGLVAALAALATPEAPDDRLARQLHLLRRHGVGVAEGLACTGEHALRLSVDLGTGVAGTLLAIDAALAAPRPVLPFLTPGGPTIT